MTIELPPPLVPAEVDLRDFSFMPLDVRRLLSSETWIEAADDPKIGHALMCLWCEAWHQVPCGSVPDNDKVLARFAMCDGPTWKRIKGVVLKNWVKCSDGLLYHQVVAEKATEAWEQKQGFREVGDNTKSRQQRWRERLREASQQLRARGVSVPAGASLETLQRLLNASTQLSQTAYPSPSTVASTVLSTVDDHEMGKTGTGTRPGEGHTQGVSPLLENPAPSKATEVCMALRRRGIANVNSSHPTLLTLIASGATVDEFTGAIAAASGKRDQFAYLLGVVSGQRTDAAAMANGLHKGQLPARGGRADPSSTVAHNPQVDATQQWIAQQAEAAANATPPPASVLALRSKPGAAP